MKEQQHTNSVKNDINIECMGFAALKQHSEKLKHWGCSAHLNQSLTGHKTDPKAGTGIEKDTEKKMNNQKESSSVSLTSVLHE